MTSNDARANEIEAELRAMWDRKDVPKEKQDAIIAVNNAKAQPGAKVGPWTIGE